MWASTPTDFKSNFSTNYNLQKGKNMENFFNNLDWMQIMRAFVVGGLICIVGQILIDKTKLTPARILVAYVTLGAILGGLRNLSAFS